MNHKKLKAYKRGIWAESVACILLFLKGYWIIARRYKSPVGEIDIIARRGNTIAIVEVKHRKDLSTALHSLDRKTKKRIVRASLHYLARHERYNDFTTRFDLIAMSSVFKIRHLDNAWEAEP